MRHRIEDLGRIAVLIDNILELEFWDVYQGRKKDIIEYFYALSLEKQQDLLHSLVYGMETASNHLHDVRSIAMGTDSLNDPTEEGS